MHSPAQRTPLMKCHVAPGHTTFSETCAFTPVRKPNSWSPTVTVNLSSLSLFTKPDPHTALVQPAHGASSLMDVTACTLTSAFQSTLDRFLGAGRRRLHTTVPVTLVGNTRLKGPDGFLKLPVSVYTTDTTVKGLHVSLQLPVLVYTQRILITSLLCVSLCYISV